MNQTIRLNKNWYIVVDRENRPKPFLVIVGEFVHRSDVVDYPIHYNMPHWGEDRQIAYDYPERIPNFVKNAIRQTYEKYPECKCRENPVPI